MQKTKNTLLKLLLCSCFLTGLQAEFIDNGDTITDSVNGLEWQDIPNSTVYVWQYAIDYCEGATTAGKDDWRLPNAYELLTLVNFSATAAPLKYATFSNIQNGGYWTGDTAHSTGYSNFIQFSTAATISYAQNYTSSNGNPGPQYYVICVRGGVN